VSDGYDPIKTETEIPLYEGQEAVDEAYAAAERNHEPFLAVERYEQGYAVTYDLLPAGHQLVPTAQEEVTARLTREVEAIVGDDSLPTTEVSRSISDSLAHLSFFGREDSARRVAAALSGVVLDETNWVEAAPPDGTSGVDAGNRRN
jgi:hypothetical protein